MAGYIGAKQSVTQVDGYNRSEADAEFVQTSGDTISGPLTVAGNFTVDTNTMFVDAVENRVSIGTTSHFGKRVNIVGGISVSGGSGFTGNHGYTFGSGGGDQDGGMFSNGDGTLLFATNNNEALRFQGDRATMFRQFYVSEPQGPTWDQRAIVVEDGTVNAGYGPSISFHAPTSLAAAVFKYWGPSNFFECRNSVDNDFIGIAAANFATVSDYRLKQDVSPLADPVERLRQLKPCHYTLSSDPDSPQEGFIAHELAEFVPVAVFGKKDAVDPFGNPQYQSVDYAKLTPLLTAALQEALTKIDALEARLSALEGA